MMSEHATSIPIFWGHGNIDPLVKFEIGKASVELLTSQLGIPKVSGGDENGIKFKVYEGVAHSTNKQELDDLQEWLKNRV